MTDGDAYFRNFDVFLFQENELEFDRAKKKRNYGQDSGFYAQKTVVYSTS